MAATEQTAPSNGTPGVEGQVSLQVFKRDGRFYVRVRVNGTLRPHISKHTDLSLHGSNMKSKVMLAAAACAEALCEDLKENVDPGATSKAAGRAFATLQGDKKLYSILG